MEQAGNSDYQNRHMSEIFEKGMSFSGFERDGLYMNLGDGTYLEISGASGLDSITDGRGCSFADFDNDGDSDVVITPVQEVARLLFENHVGQDNGFIRVSLTGTRSGRDAFGTVVRMKSHLGTQTKIKLGGSGFLSASDPRLLFGLGSADTWQSTYELEITWPSGLVETISGARPGESIHLTEGQDKAERVTERRVTLPEPEARSDRIFRTLAFEPGDRMPALTLTPLAPTSIEAIPLILEPGRKTLINFWATWCAPCAVEIPELARTEWPTFRSRREFSWHQPRFRPSGEGAVISGRAFRHLRQLHLARKRPGDGFSRRDRLPFPSRFYWMNNSRLFAPFQAGRPRLGRVSKPCWRTIERTLSVVS